MYRVFSKKRLLNQIALFSKAKTITKLKRLALLKRQKRNTVLLSANDNIIQVELCSV